ncbi:MAG: hypothetical protein U0746_19280 [Gemmataceae bacterium]
MVRRALIVLAVLTATLGAAWYALHWIPFDLGYAREAEFASVPPDDDRLQQLVRSHPGVYLAYVNRHPVGDRWRIEVVFGLSRNGWKPRLPDLDAAAASLGYRGPDGPFRYSPPRD